MVIFDGFNIFLKENLIIYLNDALFVGIILAVIFFEVRKRLNFETHTKNIYGKFGLFCISIIFSLIVSLVVIMAVYFLLWLLSFL